jgi:transglutaminase-like putative cysteine protease
VVIWVSMRAFLEPTAYIESDHPAIIRFAQSAVVDAVTPVDKAVRLYYAVRDRIRYNPYCTSITMDHYRAHYVLAQKQGFCIQKAIVLAAAARAADIPSRLGFAIVRNHLATHRLIEMMKTDLFVFHGYNAFFLNDKWVKATPAFDLALCERFGTLPLEFDGSADSIFHPYDRAGKRHMEYVYDYGQFEDFPFNLMLSEFRKYYPHFFDLLKGQGADIAQELSGDFRNEE